MGHYETASDNLERLVGHTGGTRSWRIDQLLALAQIQATLAIAEALREEK